MASQAEYSHAKFLAFSIIFLVLGVTIAGVSTLAIEKVAPPPSPPSGRFILFTNKDAYYLGETISVYLFNNLEATIEFRGDSYGVRLERLADGEWKPLIWIGNSEGTSMIKAPTATEGEGGKAALTYVLSQGFSEGKYRAISQGEIVRGGKAVSVEAHADFNVWVNPPSEMLLPLLNVSIDKPGGYTQGDTMTITISAGQLNQTMVFGSSAYGLRFEMYNGTSWEPYTEVPGLEVITRLEPRKTAAVTYKLGGHADKPFPMGSYRVIATGWFECNGQTINVCGYSYFKTG